MTGKAILYKPTGEFVSKDEFGLATHRHPNFYGDNITEDDLFLWLYKPEDREFLTKCEIVTIEYKII